MVEGLRGSSRHLSDPSFQPALMILATMPMPKTDWTPSTLRIVHSKSSMRLMVSYSVQASGWVSMMVVMTSTPMAKFEVMTSVSMLYCEVALQLGDPGVEVADFDLASPSSRRR